MCKLHRQTILLGSGVNVVILLILRLFRMFMSIGHHLAPRGESTMMSLRFLSITIHKWHGQKLLANRWTEQMLFAI